MNKIKWNKIKPALRKNNNNNQAIKKANHYTLTANYKIQTFEFRAKKGIVDLRYISVWHLMVHSPDISLNWLLQVLALVGGSMDVQRMDIQHLPSFEVMIVTATWICAS